MTNLKLRLIALSIAPLIALAIAPKAHAETIDQVPQTLSTASYDMPIIERDPFTVTLPEVESVEEVEEVEPTIAPEALPEPTYDEGLIAEDGSMVNDDFYSTHLPACEFEDSENCYWGVV